MKQRAVIYARCSTEEESQKDALCKQEAEARECVEKMGWALVDVYVESRSGTSTRGRREYQRLYEDLSREKFDIIVIKSQDRLMRNTKDWYLFVDKLTSTGKRLYMYIERKFYSADDALITGIKAILAEEYSRELSKKINLAHHNRQKNGGAVILTSHTYGYRKRPDKSVEVIEEEADIKRRMYELCAAGYGCRSISLILQKEGIRNRRGNPFSDGDILRMIRNPLNKGTVVMNRTHYDFDSKRIRKQPEDEQFIYENKVPAIVSPQLWEAANLAISSRAVKKQSPNAASCGKNPGKSPLSGKLICGLCVSPYYRVVRRRYRDKEKIYEWKCRRYLEAGRNRNGETSMGCSNYHLSEKEIWDILEIFCGEENFQERQKISHKVIRALRNVFCEETEKPKLLEARQSLYQLEKQMQILVDKLLEDVISNEIYTVKQAEFTDRKKDLEEKIKQLEELQKQQKTETERLFHIEKILMEKNVIQRAKAEALLKRTEKILVFPEYLEIYFYESDFFNVSNGNTGIFRVPFTCGKERKQNLREEIVEMMRGNPRITAKEIAKRQGISLSGANYRIRILKKEGKISFCGKGGRGEWIVCQKQENENADPQ